MMASNDSSFTMITLLDLVPQNHNSSSSNSMSMFVPMVFAMAVIFGVMAIFSGKEKKEGYEESEPPVMPSRIPFFGHLVGMLKWQVGYMQILRYTWMRATSRASATFSPVAN
jgi:hypothetical protein